MGECRDCRFWWQDGRRSGECLLHSTTYLPTPDIPESKAQPIPEAGANDAVLVTDADFGCVQWEAKP